MGRLSDMMSAFPKPDISGVTVLAVMVAWLHGVTVGVAHGDESLKQFIIMTVITVAVSVLAWRSETGKRVVAALIFFLSVSFCMCFVSSITWFRAPKTDPLPDIIHDMMPPLTDTEIPFVPGMTLNAVPDTIISLLLSSTILFVLWSPNRWFILRRFLVIYGSLMALRTVCILATSLPDAHPHCRDATPGHTPFTQMQLRVLVIKALVLFVPVGQHFTCGDMVFSGHTMILILCGMVWHTYYTPKFGVFSINYVKTFIWILVAFALFCIVATRLHYTLDVILAVFLALTTWGSYHRIAHDVRKGQQFYSLYMFDGAIVYPAIAWLEGPTNPGAGIFSHGPYGAMPMSPGPGIRRPRSSTLPVNVASSGFRGAGFNTAAVPNDDVGAGVFAASNAAPAGGGAGVPRQRRGRSSSGAGAGSPR